MRDIDTSPVKQKLVSSVVSLCRELNRILIAEGVETAAECDTLRALGCDLFQGYLFARPAAGFATPTWPERV